MLGNLAKGRIQADIYENQGLTEIFQSVQVFFSFGSQFIKSISRTNLLVYHF